MVNKDFILKSLDDAILKCSNGYSLNKNIYKSFDNFHDKYCGSKPRKSEVSQWTDKDGNEVFFKKGKKRRVDFTDKEIRDAYEEYGELNVTHNHPRGNVRPCAECLSPADINFLTYNYRPYGKRDDGSEGYLVGEEGVFPFKSISCESSNGSRMTVIRGDNFSKEDKSKLQDAARELDSYFEKYYIGFYETANSPGVKGQFDSRDYSNFDDYFNDLYAATRKETGEFHKTSEFKRIKKLFSDANCQLNVDYPFEFQMGTF